VGRCSSSSSSRSVHLRKLRHWHTIFVPAERPEWCETTILKVKQNFLRRAAPDSDNDNLEFKATRRRPTAVAVRLCRDIMACSLDKNCQSRECFTPGGPRTRTSPIRVRIFPGRGQKAREITDTAEPRGRCNDDSLIRFQHPSSLRNGSQTFSRERSLSSP